MDFRVWREHVAELREALDGLCSVECDLDIGSKVVVYVRVRTRSDFASVGCGIRPKLITDEPVPTLGVSAHVMRDGSPVGWQALSVDARLRYALIDKIIDRWQHGDVDDLHHEFESIDGVSIIVSGTFCEDES